MALGLLMPLTPSLAARTRLDGYITVSSYDVGGGYIVYGFSDGTGTAFNVAYGSVSGAASADMVLLGWQYGVNGVVRFDTAALDGEYFHFSGVSVLLAWNGSYSTASFTSEQVSGFPSSGTHPFYIGPPTVDMIFSAGQRGVLLDFTQMDTLYQDAAGTVPVTAANNPIGLVKDLSGNDFDMYQSVSTARGQYKDDGVGRVQLDKIDDNYSIDFTGTGGFEATWYQGSKEGLVVGKLLIPDGVWSLTTNPRYSPTNNVMGMIIVEGEVSESMDAAIRQWFADRGCGMDFGTMTTFQNSFRVRTDVIALDCVHWDTSSVTRFDYFAYGCSSLVTLDVSDWDTSSVTNFSGFVRGCSSLTTLDTSSWDTSSVTSFDYFAYNCSSLVTLDTSSWDVSSVTNFYYFAYGCSSLATLDTSSWDTSSVMSFDWFAYNCSSLVTLDISSWDVSSVMSFNYFAYNCSSLETVLVAPGKSFSTITTTDLISIFQNTNLSQESIDNILVNLETCAVNSGIFQQSGGSAPSAIGEAAIDSLRNRGWTITVTGGY